MSPSLLTVFSAEWASACEKEDLIAFSSLFFFNLLPNQPNNLNNNYVYM